MIVFFAAFAVAEFVVGLMTGSLALLSDAFHMISDVLSLIIGLTALRLAQRGRSLKQPFGWKRAEVIGALINGVFLMAVVLFIALEAIGRFIETPKVEEPLLLVIVGGAGLAINVIGLVVFARHASLGGHAGHSHSSAEASSGVTNDDDNDMTKSIDVVTSSTQLNNDRERNAESVEGGKANMHGVFLHVLGDALGSVAAIISGLIIMFASGEWRFYADPTLSLLFAMIVLKSSVPLVKQSGQILMQALPPTIDTKKLIVALLNVENVDFVGQLHVWTLSEGNLVASVHVDCLRASHFSETLDSINKVFEEYGVEKATVQPHFVDEALQLDVATKMHLLDSHNADFTCE